MKKWKATLSDGKTLELDSYHPDKILRMQGHKAFKLEEETLEQNEEWLNSGGAAIILDVVRRMGWKVLVDPMDISARDVIAWASKECQTIYVNDSKSQYAQAVSVAWVVTVGYKTDYSAAKNRYPVFYDSDINGMGGLRASCVCGFINRIRFASEATTALIGKSTPVSA